MQLTDGASAEQRTQWRLKTAQEYRYLNQSTCFQLPGTDNAEDFKVRTRGLGARVCQWDGECMKGHGFARLTLVRPGPVPWRTLRLSWV